MMNLKIIERIREILKKMRLFHKLILSYLLACIVPLLIASLIIYNFAVKSLEEASLELASAFNSQVATNVEEFIKDYDRITKLSLVDDDIITRLSRKNHDTINDLIDNQIILKKLLMSLSTLRPDTINIMLLGTNERFYEYSNEGSNVNQSRLREQLWFKQILESEEILFVTAIHDNSYYENRSDGVVLTVGRVILDSKGIYSGVVLFDLDPSRLIKLSESFLTTRNNYNIRISVANDDGGILYDSFVTSGRGTWDELLNKSSKSSDNKKSGDYILLSQKVHNSKLTVNAEIPKSKLLFSVAKVKYVTLLALSICLFIIIVSATLLSYSISKPLKMLGKKMQLVGDGQYTIISSHLGNDEINDLIVSYNKMTLKIKALIVDAFAAGIKQKQAKFLSLQTQINPHMLYNTLESIRMKALVNGDEEVAVMIKILSQMFRLSLGKEAAHNSIRDEIEYAKKYIYLQNIRFNNRFILEVHLSEELENSRIISLVFQPIIENSINHGFEDYDTFFNINIYGEINEENDIIIKISDNGIGMSEQKINEINDLLLAIESGMANEDLFAEDNKKSIGLRNIAERIKLHYGSKYYLKIVSTEEEIGIAVEIKIPKQL